MAPTPKPQAAKKAAADGGPAAKNGSQTLTDGELKQLKSGAAKGKESGGARTARDKKHKPKGAGSSSELRGRSDVLRHAPLVLVAVLLQLLLTWGYFHLQSTGAESSDLEPPPSQAAGAFKMARPAAPAICPSDWSGCPQVSGADWVTLAELEAAAEAEAPRGEGDAEAGLPTEEELEACGAAELLSPQRVPGMHLLCVISSPPGRATHPAVGLRLAAYKDMLRGVRPTLLLLPPNLVRPEHLTAALARRLSLPPRPPPYQPAALFTDNGYRIKRVPTTLALALTLAVAVALTLTL